MPIEKIKDLANPLLTVRIKEIMKMVVIAIPKGTDSVADAAN